MTVSLVTGRAGFMGSHVPEHLLKLGHEVVVLDDLSGGGCRQHSGRSQVGTRKVLA
jgi:nucleoside-diphosphate-sugar epimerase